GEQSGHIVFLDYSTCGDGMLSALQLINIMKETGKALSELASEMTIYPQVLKNINVTHKNSILSNPRILDEIDQITNELGDSGRILVRPSGTEELIRVMVEAETEDACEHYADRVIQLIASLFEINE